jgi:CheY-like chemotaxis protein
MPAAQKTIIVVEDEQEAAELFTEMIHFSGSRVLKAAGSGSAMSRIDKEESAAVILDIMMPDISGLEVLRYMRRGPKLANIPVVVVSAKSMPADIQTGLEAGASLYPTRPVAHLDLQGAVKITELQSYKIRTLQQWQVHGFRQEAVKNAVEKVLDA